MTEEVENLVLEHLKRIQGELTKVRDDQKTMYALQLAMQQTLNGHSTLLPQALEDIAGMKTRLDRIERRLDLVDAAQ
jgi:hypothetical protein